MSTLTNKKTNPAGTAFDMANSIKISGVTEGHELKLVSTQRDVEPLTIILDDAELSDLTRCLDQTLNDNSLAISWISPLKRPSSRKRLHLTSSHINKLINPLAGISCLFITAFAFLNLPVPQPKISPVEELRDQTSSQIDINK